MYYVVQLPDQERKKTGNGKVRTNDSELLRAPRVKMWGFKAKRARKFIPTLPQTLSCTSIAILSAPPNRSAYPTYRGTFAATHSTHLLLHCLMSHHFQLSLVSDRMPNIQKQGTWAAGPREVHLGRVLRFLAQVLFDLGAGAPKAQRRVQWPNTRMSSRRGGLLFERCCSAPSGWTW